MFTKRNLQRRSWLRFGARPLLAVLLAGAAPNFAADATGPAFDSAEQAAAALYAAVKNDDHAAIAQLIGPLASSGDQAQDKADREQFVRKYSEMRRLVKDPNGTTTLYLGAENWPFPIPLISKGGKWRFDLDAGGEEILFRRIGGNELTAMETSRAIAQAMGHPDTKAADAAMDAYVRKVAGVTTPPAESFHGYRFRILRTSAGAVVLAYPSEYGSTGFMTFAVTADGAIYEKDLGPKTVEQALAMNRYKPDRTWQAPVE